MAAEAQSIDTSMFNGIESNILKTAGFEFDQPELLLSDKRFRRILKAALDWNTFAQTYFPSPSDPTKPLVFEHWQSNIVKYAQYGEKKYMILLCPRGFGKSIVTSAIAAVAMIRMPGLVVGLYGMGQTQSTDLLDKIRFFISGSVFRALIPKRGIGLANNGERIQLYNRSDVRAFPCTDAIRGRHNQLNIIDEMSRIPDSIINTAIRPTGRNAFREIGLSTPAGMTGEFWNSWQDKKTYHTTRVGALDVSWMTPEKLEEEERRLGPFAARQELHAEFIPLGDTLINQEWINETYDIHGRCRVVFDKAFIKEAGRYMVMGADFARDSDRTVFAIGHKNQYGVYMLDYMESILKAPYPVIEDRLVHLCDLFNVRALAPDATGLGEPILDHIIDKFHKKKIKTGIISNNKKRAGFVYNHNAKLDLVNRLMAVYADGVVSVPFHQNNEQHESLQLERELLAFKFNIKNTGSAKVSIRYGTQTEKDDRVNGLALMIYGIDNRKFSYHRMVTA